MILFDQFPALKDRLAHLNSQSFAFIAASHHATVIVTQHQDRPVMECAIKGSLARYVEVVAIDQRIDSLLHDFIGKE